MIRRSLRCLREPWEYEPSYDHKVLVLTMYRNCLKGLLNFKSVRKRTMITFCRMTFRKRGKATEKLLIDECIEEARRAIFVLSKCHTFSKTGDYEFDSMCLPKDTQQNVKSFMEEQYEPYISKQYIAANADVVPGKEDKHVNKPQRTRQETVEAVKSFIENNSDGDTISTSQKQFRPPPPPTSM